MNTSDSTTQIPYGYCHCGCGQKTKICDKNHTKHGHVKGEPKRFIAGHYAHVIPVTPLPERFWSKVAITIDVDKCWEWKNCKFKNGYGKLGLGGRKEGVVYAHRIAWELTNGKIPEDLHVLHKCDNRACVNPNHLFLGTHQDNMDDMISKGRNSIPPIKSGESNSNHKLTWEKVNYIRKSNLTRQQLAHELNLSVSTIGKVIRHESWNEAQNENE